MNSSIWKVLYCRVLSDTVADMKPIRLPEPPESPRAIGGMPDIFEGGVYGVIRRAVVIGNGFPSSENQSIGLVRALGLYDKHTLYVSLVGLIFVF